jgi:hypothetical protein
MRDQLVLYAENELAEPQRQAVTQHLASCARCREEAAGIDRIRTLLADPELFAPEPTYAWQILPGTLAARVRDFPPERQTVRVRTSSLAWTFAMAATLVLSIGLVWLSHRVAPTPAQPALVATRIAPGNEAFLKRIQSVYAREQTATYLNQCQDLLLNVVRAEQNCQGDKYDVSLEVERARALLTRKRLLDRELQAPEVASARELCDDLEHFLFSLSLAEKCQSPDKLQRMETFIQRQQLLLRINVLQSELS